MKNALEIPSNVQFSVHTSIEEIPEMEWNELTAPYNLPFYSWGWLKNLEVSGSIGSRAGILPCYFSVRREGRLQGIAPLFLKYHSSGEFIFDRPFAEAAENSGFVYYPKLIGMSPYTPANGYRFFFSEESESKELNSLLLKEIKDFANQKQIFSIQFLYADPNWKNAIISEDFYEWNNPSYIWQNPGFENFEDYLLSLNSKRRKNIRQEREKLAAHKIRFCCLEDDQITEEKLSLMHRFYVETCNKFLWWGSRYLTRKFFQNSKSFSRENLLLIEAMDTESGRTLGMSFFLKKGDKLFGRYWGCEEHIDFLHFELCYYRPIRWCIENRYRSFDAGSGNGPHKKRRGFPAQVNSSLLFFADPQFFGLVKNYLKQYNQQQLQAIEEFNAK